MNLIPTKWQITCTLCILRHAVAAEGIDDTQQWPIRITPRLLVFPLLTASEAGVRSPRTFGKDNHNEIRNHTPSSNVAHRPADALASIRTRRACAGKREPHQLPYRSWPWTNAIRRPSMPCLDPTSARTSRLHLSCHLQRRLTIYLQRQQLELQTRAGTSSPTVSRSGKAPPLL
jgi:hypothetical protein